MARTDNLTNFLTDVAGAIREKKGTTEPISASEFDTEIASIETGGGSDEGAMVTFSDYNSEGYPQKCTFKKVQLAGSEKYIPRYILSSLNKYSSYGNHYFYRINTVEIPESLQPTVIGSNAFYNLTKLKTINIPQTVTEIQDYAFYQNQSLSEITLPNNLITLGSNAFSNCVLLKSIVIPQNVTLLLTGVFIWCSSLKTVECLGDIQK